MYLDEGMLQAESVVCKHKSISHFKGKMPSFISSNATGYPPGITRESVIYIYIYPCFLFFFKCITLHQWYNLWNSYVLFGLLYQAFFINQRGWGRRPFASFERLLCMQKLKYFYSLFYKGEEDGTFPQSVQYRHPPTPHPSRLHSRRWGYPIVVGPGCLFQQR